MSDDPPAKRAKFVARDQQRKIRLVHIGRALEGPLPVPQICDLVKEYANEFDGIQLLTRAGPVMSFHMAAMAVLNDGCLAYTSNAKVMVWDADKGAVKMELLGHTAEVSTLLVLDGQKLASGSADCTVRVWDVGTGACVFVLEGHASRVFTLTLLEAGTLVSTSGQCVHVWDLTTGALLKKVRDAGPHYVKAVQLSNSLLAFASCEIVSVFDVGTGKTLRSMAGHTYIDMALCVLPDKRLACAAIGGSVWLWDDPSSAAPS